MQYCWAVGSTLATRSYRNKMPRHLQIQRLKTSHRTVQQVKTTRKPAHVHLTRTKPPWTAEHQLKKHVTKGVPGLLMLWLALQLAWVQAFANSKPRRRTADQNKMGNLASKKETNLYPIKKETNRSSHRRLVHEPKKQESGKSKSWVRCCISDRSQLNWHPYSIAHNGRLLTTPRD